LGKVIERLKIVGVDCPSCIYGIEKKVLGVKGVLSFRADYISGEAVVEYDDEYTSLNQIVKAVREAGYDVVKEYLEVFTEVEGEEVYILENRFKKIPGVIDCRISPVSGVMRIVYNPYTVSREVLEGYLKKFGIEFSREVVKKVSFVVPHDVQMYVRFTAFVLALIAIVYHNLGVLAKISLPLWIYRDFLFFSISTIVILLNIDIVFKGLRSLAKLSPSMESLITLSSLSSYLFSVAIMLGFLKNSETFFEASAGVLGFVGLGKFIESRIRGRVAEEIERFGGFLKGKVKLVKGSVVEEVDVEKVSVNDIVEFKAGEKILVDGVVVDGWGYVDESAFTGESMPRLKKAESRDPVFAGTVLVSGYLKVRVTRVSRDTVLSHIVETVKESLFTKPRIQMVADRIVGYMTWAVIVLSLITFIYWFTRDSIEKAVLFMASVLAVTCPCPLGIAIPMVYAIAVYRLTKLGLLVRRGDVFEKAIAIDVAIFDKTGTLTIGKPSVDKVLVFNSSEEEIMKIVCSAESRSEHPLASAIMRYCRDRGYVYSEPSKYDHIPGLGIVAEVNNSEVVVGSEKLVTEMGIAIPEDIENLVVGYRKQGYTVIFIGLNKVLSGVILLRDSVREDVVEVIDFLRKRNVKTVIASGDSRETVEVITKNLNIDEFYSELTPDDKIEFVDELQKKGFKVMFVGDGVNDAGAISRSFLGIAMGSGSDIAKIAGDVVIINDKIKSLKILVMFSEKVRKKSIENLAWAFIYNLTLVPIAMGALYSISITLRPELAALAMIASDISVVLNSLTLMKSSIG
jgi:Cu2+-exporting ATPase/Cu+-exporting ATPase